MYQLVNYNTPVKLLLSLLNIHCFLKGLRKLLIQRGDECHIPRLRKKATKRCKVSLK